jgi:polysaccharide biosynthesis protein PslG
MRRGIALALSALLALLLAGCGGCGGGGGGGGGNGGGGGAAQRPEAHPNDPFYGVISAEPQPGSDQLARLGDAGAGTLRVNFAWVAVQSGPDAPYDWSHYDPLVRGAAENGVRVLATVYSTPVWAAPTPEDPPLGRALEGFSRFTRAAVERYGDDGTFWAQHPDVPKLPIVDWGLWNEPNSPLFWKPTPDPAAYLKLLRAFSPAVKGADPRAHVLLGGLFPDPTGGIPLDSFLSAIYAGGGRRLFDAADVHPYAGTPAKAIARVAQARDVMRRFGDADKPIWISEVGWASGGAPSGLTVGAARQADYLRQVFEMATADRARLGLAGVVWFSLNDTPGPLWVGHCGLFGLDGSPKPSWKALAQVAGGSAG